MWWWRARRGNNPLLRRLEPVERAAGAAVALLGMLLVAGVAVATLLTSATANRLADTQGAGHHQVGATVEQVSAPVSSSGTYVGAQGALPYREHLQWQWQGQTHTGTTMVTAADASGTGRQVWVNDAGRLTTPPVRHSDAVAMTVIAGIGAAMIGLALLVAAVQLQRSWLLRRRMRDWQDEWQYIGPLWTGYSGRY